MAKKVFIVSSTPRERGNSDILAEEFARGARDAGHEVRKVNIREMQLQFCIGCLYCQNHEGCVLQDGMNALYESVQNADVLVFATPVYYYGMSGQLKTFLDRLNPLFPRNNKFREVYLLASAAEDDGSAMDGAVSGVPGLDRLFRGRAPCGRRACDGRDRHRAGERLRRVRTGLRNGQSPAVISASI